MPALEGVKMGVKVGQSDMQVVGLTLSEVVIEHSARKRHKQRRQRNERRR